MSPNVRIAVGWFPGSEFTQALSQWPDLVENTEAIKSYQAYCRYIEAQLHKYKSAGCALSLAPIRMKPFLRWYDVHAKDAGSSQARAEYAAECARVGETLPWPPGRNDSCWCGSGRKYKKCCLLVKIYTLGGNYAWLEAGLQYEWNC
jgi:hypothetical protein